MTEARFTEIIWCFLNEWPEKPNEVRINLLEKSEESIGIFQVLAEERERTYVDGGSVGRWPFAVMLRVRAAGDAGKLRAMERMGRLFAWMRAQPLPPIGEGAEALGFVMLSGPRQAASHPDGTCDYQVEMALRYKEAADAE